MVTVSIPCWLIWVEDSYVWQIPGSIGLRPLSPVQGAALLGCVDAPGGRSIRNWIQQQRSLRAAVRAVEQAARCSLSEDMVMRLQRSGQLPEDPGPYGLLVNVPCVRSRGAPEQPWMEMLGQSTCRLHLQMVEGTDPVAIELRVGEGGVRLIESAA